MNRKHFLAAAVFGALLTACGGSKQQAPADEQAAVAEEPSVMNLAGPQALLEAEGCPFASADEVLGYWRSMGNDSIVTVLYRNGRQYYAAYYNARNSTFRAPLELKSGKAKGRQMYKCTEHELFYEVNAEDGRLMLRPLSDVDGIIDYEKPVEWTGAEASAEPAAKAATAFVLDKGKLGPIEMGKARASLPEKEEGLYDSFRYKKETMSDMDGEWEEELLYFNKGGKDIVSARLEGGKIAAISLLEGSEFITTPDGFHVGYNARELFNKLKVEWETYFEGYAFASKGGYTYYVDSRDVPDNDLPQKATDLRADAPVVKIVYSK